MIFVELLLYLFLHIANSVSFVMCIWQRSLIKCCMQFHLFLSKQAQKTPKKQIHKIEWPATNLIIWYTCIHVLCLDVLLSTTRKILALYIGSTPFKVYIKFNILVISLDFGYCGICRLDTRIFFSDALTNF